ncbi:type III secretion system chaperone [Planctomicrobium sp. SH668]|uniref:type III secretion system chaperone n=1 Tax=Planctomicrobium sp. SH668 TaxID=3448126 RepID=UPI003F5C9CD5
MELLNRRTMILSALAGAAPVALANSTVMAQDAAAARLNEDQLGQLIGALGLQPTKKQKRYDFAFQADVQEQQWELSMSAVLSHDESSVWLMAWLDELPQASNDVPRTALLRLLAQNDQLGDGKFFAYIPANRRFVLQRTVENQNLNSARLRLLLQDLGNSVVENYPIWHTGNWGGTPSAPITGGSDASAKVPAASSTKSATNDSKFEQSIRR